MPDIYNMPKPKGYRSEGAGIYIRQIPSGHGISQQQSYCITNRTATKLLSLA